MRCERGREFGRGDGLADVELVAHDGLAEVCGVGVGEGGEEVGERGEGGEVLGDLDEEFGGEVF